jgi:hypothetical protein
MVRYVAFRVRARLRFGVQEAFAHLRARLAEDPPATPTRKKPRLLAEHRLPYVAVELPPFRSIA